MPVNKFCAAAWRIFYSGKLWLLKFMGNEQKMQFDAITVTVFKPVLAAMLTCWQTLAKPRCVCRARPGCQVNKKLLLRAAFRGVDGI